MYTNSKKEKEKVISLKKKTLKAIEESKIYRPSDIEELMSIFNRNGLKMIRPQIRDLVVREHIVPIRFEKEVEIIEEYFKLKIDMHKKLCKNLDIK